MNTAHERSLQADLEKNARLARSLARDLRNERNARKAFDISRELAKVSRDLEKATRMADESEQFDKDMGKVS